MTKARALSGSIAFKFGSVLAVVSCLLFLTTWISFTQFGRFSVALTEFSQQEVPNLVEGSVIIEKTGELTKELSHLLISTSKDEMATHLGEAQTVLQSLRQAKTHIGAANEQGTTERIERVSNHLARVAEARKDAIVSNDGTLAKVQDLGDAIATASARLLAISDISYLSARSTDPLRPAGELRIPLTRMAKASELERLLGDLNSVILTGVTAEQIADVAAAQATASEKMAKIRNLQTAFADDQTIPPAINRIDALVGPEDGILAGHEGTLIAHAAASEESRIASDLIQEIIVSASKLEQSAIDAIKTASGTLTTAAGDARITMVNVTLLAILCIAFAAAVTVVSILRPLRRVIGVTERLAGGDFSPVTGLDRQGGEIGRMARALTVFRDSMIERERLAAEEALHAEEARRRKDREERDAREREESDRRRRAEAEAEKFRREQEEFQHREARAAEQNQIVTTLATALQKLAAGDLGVHLREPFPAAYESLRKDFNTAVASLSDLISAIAETAGRIDDNASEIAAASDELSRRTESSAATLEETAAALNEMTTAIASAASMAAQANAVATEVNGRAEESGHVVKEATSAMSEIESSARRIATIIDVIDHIARQTNLLALNAAVEAARAGDAGRGFAVVASEVRALAQRASQAAGEISSLISDSNDQVVRGARLVDAAGQALHGIVGGVKAIALNIDEITRSSQAQAGGINELNAATGQLDQTMQRNAAMTEETTAATRLLTEESRRLRAMVQRFRVAKADRDVRAPPQVA